MKWPVPTDCGRLSRLFFNPDRVKEPIEVDSNYLGAIAARNHIYGDNRPRTILPSVECQIFSATVAAKN